MRYRREVTTAALLAITLLAASAPARADSVDDSIQAEMGKLKIPGLALAVVRDGEVVKSKGYGLANVELNVPVTPETIFQSGSVGKQFTATLVMMLAGEGKLSLEDPLRKFFPEAPASWKDITVRRLLTHTSGISNVLYNRINMRQDYTEDELVREIAALPLDFQPGEKWSYSNPGYVLLGVLVHRVTGKFYGDVMREKIFAPLGMTTARIISEADIVPNRAAGYRLVNGELKNQEWVSPTMNTTADGALYLTVQDMVKWDAGLASEKLLNRAALDRMWTPVKLNDGKAVPYGFGWVPGETRGHRFVQHGGEWQGFSTHILRFLDKKLSVIVLTNLSGVNAGAIATSVARLYDADLAPPERTVVRIDPKILDSYVGRYELATDVVLNLSREGDKLWFQALNQPRREIAAESETVFFFPGADATIRFVKDASGKVTGLILRQGGFDREAKRIE